MYYSKTGEEIKIMGKKIVLASASPRRREIFTQLGLDFTVCPAVGEEVLHTTDPGEAVLELSLQKALEVAAKQGPGTYVVGSDTVVAFDGLILGKPKDEEDAVSMLKMLSGNTHTVHTGVAVIDTDLGLGKPLVHFEEKTDVTMYPMDEEWIRAYVATGEPLDKAGAYAVQGGTMPYLKGINGEYNTVVGFPAARFYQEMLAVGVRLL